MLGDLDNWVEVTRLQYSHDYPVVQLTLLKWVGCPLYQVSQYIFSRKSVCIQCHGTGGITVQLREARRGSPSRHECVLEGLAETEGGVEVLAESTPTPTGRTAPRTGLSHCAESNRQ